MRLRFVKKMFWVILQNLQETTGPLILGGRGTMCSITHVDVSLFHFDNDSTWKVLLVKIFPVFDFSTSFKPSGSFNGLKWKCSWGFIPDLCGFIEALTALRDFHFVKSISVLYELCSSKAWDLLTALNHLRWSLFFDKNCTYRMCIKKETSAQVFYFEFCEICKNTFFVEHFAFNYRKN